jgi:peptidyl-prolyl cis-trans isomerase SurA
VKAKFISLMLAGLFVIGILALMPERVAAQEGELKVVDEVIAQVNDEVITLSMLRRESKERVDALKQGGMPEKQATTEVMNRQAELIATLINEQLLLQKGKELNLASEVEAEVNRRMLDVAKEQGITSIERLDEAMRQSGVDPAAIRQSMRIELMKNYVIQGEVDRKLFFGFTMDELKKYFEANREKFRRPESVTLSEIFLSFAGKNEADVKAHALQLVAQLRAGADFGTVAAANSERERDNKRTAPEDKGKVGTFEVPNLREEIAASIKSVRVGGISDPLRSNDGYQIFRVDERTAASDAVVFNENLVREAMTIERGPKERDVFLQDLRNEAYIKVSDTYAAAVMPLLKLTTASAAKTKESEKDSKNKNKRP